MNRFPALRSLSLTCLAAVTMSCGKEEPPTTPGPETANTPLATAMLAEHNQVRAAVSPKPSSALPVLTWSEDAARAAQTWANACTFKHDENRGPYGENLAAAAPKGSLTDAGVVQGWAAEATDYTYDTNTCASGKVCGHYTQVVWRNTTQVGCATAVCTQNSPWGSQFPEWQIWVCRYAPPGNYVGQKPY